MARKLLRLTSLYAVGGLSLLGCASNADAVYQAEVARRDRETALDASRRVTVRKPGSSQPLEVHELALDENGEEVSHGTEQRYWPEGNLRSLRSFDGGVPAGLWWSWWRTGALRSAYVHKATEATRMTWWYANGVVSAEGMAISGRRVGVWSYYHENGALESRGEMSGGGRIGPWTFYDEAGEWTERGEYVSGKRAGDWEFRSRVGNVPFLNRR